MRFAGEVLLLVGALLILVAAVGAVQFPDALARMHALAKASTGGVTLALGGAALATAELNEAMSLLFAAVLQATTNPVASTLLTQATYYAEGIPIELHAVDELAETLDAADDRLGPGPPGRASVPQLKTRSGKNPDSQRPGRPPLKRTTKRETMSVETSNHVGTIGNVAVTTWMPDGSPSALAVLSHGYGEHARRYDHVADALTAAGMVVVAPDHQGHGASDGERASIVSFDTVVDDLRDVVEAAVERHGEVPLVLIGHSMGGLIATRYVQRYPGELDALVLSGPFFGNPGIDLLLELDPIPDLPIDPAVLSRDPAVGEAYAADPLVYHGPFRRETLLAFGEAVEAVAGETLGEQPTLWVHGTDDQLAPYPVAATMMEGIAGPNLRHVAYDGAAHEVFNETNRDEVIAEVVGFVTAAVAGRSA